MNKFKLEKDPKTKGKQIVRVSGGVTISDAGQFRDALLTALKGGEELEVDLSEVTGIDLTGLQLLCATHQSAVRCGKALHLSDGGNATFREIAAGAGFQRHMGCARDVSSSCIWVGGES